MTALKDLLFADLEVELESTRRMLERFPDDRADWKPHEKSGTLQQVARHVAELPGFALVILTTDSFDVRAGGQQRANPTTRSELLALFDRVSAALRDRVAQLSDEQLQESWSLLAAGQVIFSGARAVMVRRMGITHLAHHRAQLGVYYRLLDLPVPGMYGPSADERAAQSATKG